jgi:SAM-dependent methyltransferase
MFEMTAFEVPSPIDFSDHAQALAWVKATTEKRPWRPHFFSAFAHALNSISSPSIRIAELGSGPGHLARVILETCPHIAHYSAIDFSPAMHELARAHLDQHAPAVNFEVRDFRHGDWAAGLGAIDAIVTMQAAHEVRHKTRLPRLLSEIHAALKPGGMLLFCDHYAEVGSSKNPELHPEYAEQRTQFEVAGFVAIVELLNKGGMALYQCRKVE